MNMIYLIYMHTDDLALSNIQWLICHKTQPNQTAQSAGAAEYTNCIFTEG